MTTVKRRPANKPFLPYAWNARLGAAGLSLAEIYVVATAATKAYVDEDGRTLCPWATRTIAGILNCDRKTVLAAKEKLGVSGLGFVTRSAGTSPKKSDIWDLTVLFKED